MLAAPDIAGLPQLASMLLAPAAWSRRWRPHRWCCSRSARRSAMISIFAGSSRVRRCRAGLLAQRLSLLLAIGLAVYVAAAPPADYLQLALWSFALAAAGLFPALVLGRLVEAGEPLGGAGRHARRLRGRRLSRRGRRASIPQLSAYLEQAGTGRLRAQPRQATAIVCAAVPAGFVVAILVSLVTPAAEGRRATPFAEALARAARFSRRRRARIASKRAER